jgi:cbb3-type cytochrome oxidase maturation protein
MSSLIVLIPLGMALTALAVACLIYAVNSGQFDALDDIGRRMPDDEP